MAIRDLSFRVRARAGEAGVPAADGLCDALAGYLALLGRWNQRINLTAFDLNPPTDEAIDRLIVEPLAAARHVRSSDRVAIDIGSGGGSPALPLKLAAPQLAFTLIESKARKAAFLREAVRQLGLIGVDVEDQRLEELTTRTGLQGSADLVTIRAVRVNDELLKNVSGLLRPGGRVLAFTAARPEPAWPGWRARDEALVAARGSVLSILSREETPG